MNEDSIKKFYENTKRINPSFNMEYDDFCDRMQDPISRKKFYENTRKLNPAFRISDEEADAILGFTTSNNQQQEPKQSFGSKLLQNAGPFVPAGGTVYGMALAEKKEQERQAEEADKREKERRHQAAMTIGITDKDTEQMAQRDALSQKVNAESVKMFTPTLSYTPFNEDGSFNPLGMKKTDSEEYNQAKKELEEFERNMPSYLTRGEKTAEDIFTNAAERFRNTEEGKKAADEITQKYVEEFLQSEDFQRVRNNGEEAVYKEFNRLYEDRINTEYSEMVQSVMKDYIEDANERLGIRNTDNSIVGLDSKLQVLRTKRDEYNEFTNVSEKEIQERYTQEHGSTMQQDIKDPAAVMAVKQAYYEKIRNEKVEEALERGMVPVNGNTLRHAETYINKSKELIDAVKNDKGFFGAMGNTLSDIDTWSMGLTEIGRNLDVMNICKKVDENGGDLDVLSEDEQALLESVTTYMATCAYYSPKLNRAYKAGQTTAASIPFMLSIMLGSGFTKAAGQGFVKVFGKVAERMLGKYVEKQSIKVAGKVAGKAVETLVRSEIMTATFGAPRVAAGTIDRMTGDIGFRFSNDGKIEYDGREGQQGFGEALWNSHADTFIEYWSEDAFRILDPLGVAIKGSKWFGNIARKAEGNYILQDIIKLRNQPWLRNLRESTQFQSFPEEVLEEELGGVLRIISTTDTKVKNEDGTTNWEKTWKNAGLDIDSQIDIVLGLAPTSLFMGGIGAAGFYGGRSINYANFKKNLSSEEDKKLFKQIMKETRSGEFAEGAHTLIRNILTNDNLSVEQKREMILDVSSQYYKVMSDELQGMYRQTQVEPIIEATQHEGSDVIFNTTDDKGRKVCIVGGKLQFKQQDTDNGPVDMLDKENSDDKVYVRVYGDDGSISKVYEVDASTLTNPITNISNSDMREFLNAQKHALFNGDKTFAVGDDTFNTDTGELIESNKPDNADTETDGNVPDGGGQQVEQDAEENELEGYLQPVNTRPHIMNRQFEIRMPNGTTRTVGITSRSVALKEDGTIDEKRSSFAIRNEKDKIILGDEKQQCLDAINAILLSERNAEIEQARQKKADDEAARASKTQGSKAERKVAGEVAGEAQEGTATEGQEPAGASGVQDDVTPTPAAQEEGVAPVQDNGPTPAIPQEQGEQQDEQPSAPTEEEQWNAAVAEATSMQKADGTFKPDATPEHKVVAIIGADKTGMQDAVDVAKAEIADIDNSLSTIDGNKRLSATDRLFRKRKLTDERQAWIDAIRKYVGEEAATSLETPTAPIKQETPTAPVEQGTLADVEGAPSADNVQHNIGAEQASQENAQETVGDVSMGDTEGAPVAQSKSGNEERISETDAATILKQIEDEAEEAEEIELTPENWYAQFGEDGIVETPIGKVKMGEHQYLKLAQKGREGKLGMIKPTLERPTIIIEDKSKANDGQKTERESSFVFVKAFVNKAGERMYYFTSVTVMKDGQEVVVSNQEKRKSVITNLLNKGNLVWKHADNVSSVSDITNGLYSSQGVKTSDPTIEGTDAPHTKTLYSADKGSENNPNDQTFDEENAEKVENESENGVSAGVHINPMSSEYALVKTSNNRVEWARVGMDEAGNPILDEAGNPVYYSLNTNKPIKRTAIDKNIVYLKDANEGYQPYILMSIIKPQDIKHHTRNTFRLMDMNGNILDVNSNELFYQEEGSEEYVPAVESKKNTDTPDSILNTLIYNFKKGGAYRLSDLVKEGFTNIGRGRYITPYDKLMQRIANETGLKGVELADVTRSVNSVLNEAVSRWNRMVELRGYDEKLANSTGLDHNVMTSMYGDKRSLIIGNRFRKGTDTQNVDNPACQLVAAVDMAQQMGLIEEGTFNVAGYNALRYSIPKKWLSKSDAKNEKEAEKATYDELVKQYNTLKKQRDALQKQLDDNPDMPYRDSETIKGTINKIKNQMNDVADEMDMLDGIRMQRTGNTTPEHQYVSQYAEPSDFTEDGNVKPEVLEEIRRERDEIERKEKADGTWMKAPNGEPTNLTQEQWVTVRTKRFKNWFGDWEKDPENASKVVDENGEPLVVYHGTKADFNEFSYEFFGKTDEGNSGKGFYFTPNKNSATPYAKNGKVKEVFLNIRNLYNDTSWGTNPISDSSIFNRSIEEFKQSLETQMNEYRENGASEEEINQYQKMIDDFFKHITDKYNIISNADGIASYRKDGSIYEYVVKSPNQIKSAEGNVGTFSNENGDIRYQHNSTHRATAEQVNAVAEQLQKAMPNTEVVVAQDMEEATAVMSERTGMSEEELREELGDGTVAGASLPDGSVVLVSDSVRMDTAFHEFAHKLYAFAKKSGGPLLDAINKYIEQAPQAIKDYVSSHYPDAVGTDAYLDEVFAWALSKQSGKKIEQFLAERGLGSKDVMENMRQQAWYSRMWNAIKRLWNIIKTEFSDRFGSKYADLSVFDAYQTMSAEEIGNNLYDTLMGGKELAEQKNAKKSSKDLVNSKKKRNFAIVKSGKSNRLAINITQNAGEDRSANRLGELNEQDRLDYKDALSELRRTDITDEERKAAEDTIERIQSRRKEQMKKLVEEALKGIEGVRVAGISEGTGVYLNGEEEVIEYTSQVDLDVEEGQEDSVVAAMAMIAEVTKQDSFIVNYPDGITDKGWHSQQVHITTENPLTKQQVAKLSDEFTKHDLGVTIIGNEIYTGNFDDNLSNDDFVRIVNQIIEKFYKDGNAETRIRSTRNSQENVQELDGIPFILGEQSLDGNTMLGTCKIKARVNYSSFNAAKNKEDEYCNSKYLDRYGNETATDRYYGEYYGGTEEEGSVEHPIQNTSITPSDLRKRLQGALISSDFSIEKKRIIERAKADGTYMKAPNGKPSNLSEDLWATIRTKSFKRWFGDWEKDPENASKVVDENGEPLVVYHGSRHAGFDMFMLNGSGSQGIYTTDSRDAANTYATNVSERRVGVQQGEAIIGAAEHHGIYPLFVNMKNPKRYDFGGREWDRYGEEHYIVMSDADELGDTPIFDTEEEANEYARTQGGEENGYYVLPKYTTSDELLIETLQDGAYDGCVFTNYKDGHPRGEAITSYVPFSSNQLKSSTQNSGEFGLQDDRINHQRVGSRSTGKKRTAKSLFSKKVPKSEIAVARKALFEAMFGQRKLYNPIGVYSANYYHVFQNNTRIGSILIEGNEEKIKQLNKRLHNGIDTNREGFDGLIERIWSGQDNDNSNDAIVAGTGRGNAGTDNVHSQTLQAGKSGNSGRDRGKVSRVDSAVSTRGGRGGIRLQVTGGGYDLITDGGVPKNELAVANKALFELRYGNRRTERFIDVYSANYWHIFDGNKRIGSIQIEGNEDLIKTYKEALHGIDTSRERPDDIIEAIRGRAWDYNRTDADVTQQGGGNDTTNPNVAEQKDGTRRDNSKGVGTIRASSRIRLQVTGGGYYSNSDFVPVDPKKAEAIKKKSEDMKHAVKTAMRKPSVVSKKTAAWLAAKTAATLDRTEGVRRLDYSLDEWLKANGRKGTHMRYNVRQRIEAANSTIRYRVQQLEKKELRHLNEVVRNLVKEVEGSAMYNKYKIEKQPDVYGEQIYLTPVQFIERYLISRDNMERYDMGIDRGLQEFQERMGVDMATFMEEFERTYFSGKEGEAKRMELWNAIRDVTDISLNESLDSGIISEEAYNKMMNRKFYVPERDYAAKNDEDDSDGVVKRRGRKKLKPASIATKAEGGNSLADNVLAHIMDDAIDSITKAEKNRVKLCMYKMLTENKEWCREIGIPIPTEVFYVKNEDGTYSRKDNAPTADERIAYAETMQTINELKNELLTTADESVKEAIKSEIQKLEASLPYIDAATASKLFVEDAKNSLSSVCVMVDGVANEMIFPHMEYVADALNDRFNKSGQIDIIKKITGFIAAQFTVNNPTFFAVNICRDVPYVLRKGSIEYGFEFQARFTRNFAMSQRAVWRYLTNKETLDKETSQMLQNFLDSGGQMGYSNIPNIYDMKASVEALNEEGELRQKDGAYYASMVLSLGTARLANTLNDWSEIITRFSAYKSVIEMGLGHEEAMKASANLSCNFNRRGLGNTFFNFFSSLSMFVNAAVQGASSFYRSFDTMKHAARGFFNLMLGPAFFGFLSTLLSPDDDDEEFAISDFDRDNYFCLGNWRIPLNEQLKPFWVIGVNIALGMSGRRDSSEIANSIISSLVRNLLPLPQNITNTAIMFTDFATGDKDEWNLGKAINSMFMPEALKTSVQLAQNENFLGNKIRYNTGDRPQIDFDDNEAQLYQDVCELFYLLGGGKEGSHSLTREDGSKVKFDFGAKELKQYMFVVPQGTQDMLLSAYGIGKASVQSVLDDVPMSDALKENVRWRDVPIVNRFYHPTDSALFRYSVKKEATSLVNDRRIVIENIKREVKRYSKMKEDATNSGNLELAAEMNDALESEIRKLNNVLTKEYKILEEHVDNYNKINYANVAKKSLNMNEKEFKKKFPDIDYENIDDNLKNLASSMLTFMYIMDGNERIDKKIPDMIRGKLGGSETVKEYFDKKKVAGE